MTKLFTTILCLFLTACATASAATLIAGPFTPSGPAEPPVPIDNRIYGNVILPENDGGPDATDDLLVYIEALTGYLKYGMPVGDIGSVNGTGTDNRIVRWDGTNNIQDNARWFITDGTSGVIDSDDGSTQTQINPNGSISFGALSGGSFALRAKLYADAHYRFIAGHGGKLEWGPGTATADTTLERSGTSELKTTGTGFHIDGPQKIKRTAVSNANYTILATDYLIALTAISAARTWTLPDATTNAGQVFEIKDESGSITPTNKLTIDTAGGNIDGVATYDITVARGALKVYSNGTHYFVI